MAQFRYRAVNQLGALIAGVVEAPNREEVIRRIEYLGHLPIETEETKNARITSKPSFVPRARDLTLFFRELSLLVDAGLSLAEALEVLGESAGKKLAQLTAALGSSILAGESFADALQVHTGVIAPSYVAMVEAGEMSGKLSSVLKAISTDLDRTEKLRQGVLTAIRYPAFLMLASVLILLLFLIVVIPQFEPLFIDVGGKLNGGAAAILALSKALRSNADLALGGGLALLLVGGLVATRPGAKSRMLVALSRIPFVSGVFRDRRTARVLGMLGLLVGNGVPLPTAVKLCREVSPDPAFTKAVDQIHGQLRSGRRFGDTLLESRILPQMAVRMLKVGEETGELSDVAMHAAEFFEQRLQTGLTRIIAVIGPLTIIIVSLFIGSLIISIMSALLSITELAQ